jgi:hypothetical protein
LVGDVCKASMGLWFARNVDGRTLLGFTVQMYSTEECGRGLKEMAICNVRRSEGWNWFGGLSMVG